MRAIGPVVYADDRRTAPAVVRLKEAVRVRLGEISRDLDAARRREDRETVGILMTELRHLEYRPQNALMVRHGPGRLGTFPAGTRVRVAQTRLSPAAQAKSRMPALRAMQADIDAAKRIVAALRRDVARKRRAVRVIADDEDDDYDPSGYGDGDRPDSYADPDQQPVL